MYSFSEEGGYCLQTTTETTQYSPQTQTFQQTTTTELQWEFTSNGFQKVQASDLLFNDDSHKTPVKVVVSQHEQETEYQKCQTWYVPSKPVEKPSHSQEYVAPHKRFEGYDRTGRNNIRRRGESISSSGESYQTAQSRSHSRQRHQQMQSHRRSSSRSSYKPNSAPAVSRERFQSRPQLMGVVNLTRNTKRVSTRNKSVCQPAPAPTQSAPRARKVNGVWIKGHVEPKPKVCYQFLNHGTCSYGDRCKFAHVAKKSRNTRTRRHHTGNRNNTAAARRNQQVQPTTTSFVAPNRFAFTDDGTAW